LNNETLTSTIFTRQNTRP